MGDREKLIKLLEKQKGMTLPIWMATQTVELMADALLANGVTVQKHGRWEETVENWVACSICGDEWNGAVVPYEDFNFCPNCGARMDGE